MQECPVCLNPADLQGHHIWPLSYNGPEDGPMVDLCASCHLSIHHQAENLCSRAKRKRYFTDEQMKRARPFIVAIIKAKLAFKDGDGLAVQGRNLVSFSLDPRKRKLLQLLKTDAGFDNVEDYLTSLIDRELFEKLGIK